MVDLDENVVVGDTLCQMKPGDVTSTEEVCDSLIERDSEKIVAKDDDGVGQKSDSVQNSRPPDSLFQASNFRDEERIKMSRMRQRIAQRLKQSQDTTAMLTTFNEVDMTNAMKARSEHKDAFEEIHGARLGFMSFFAKASSQALMDTPSVNAYIDDETNEIVYRHYVDISVAVASPRGLVVPVLRNVESMDFAAVEKSISKFGKKAQNDEITMEDMTGGTFTISNGGVFGSMMGTPILNPPQSAIWGCNAIKQRPVVVNNEIVARPIMFLALTYDHRLIDGRETDIFEVGM